MQKIVLFLLAIILSLSIMQDISSKKALEIAEKECKDSDWDFSNVSITETEDKSKWFVLTNKSFRGGNALIYIDKQTGKIISKQYNSK
ncbi:MAG: hypothetical protein A2402_00400 [Candidatus Staskawiczbacteria bacterium RIFOXYC1_FULL_37_43]|nr:MAG: hypothetical protein A2813_00810 [Candidatus Staskawiczbacteria bacterium RIFCSPHIGHO2_01_FULL_37_17]OGZ72323.1 MAG: hypothetical protein A2891_03580 [Candidatus Staskawiczbacteria bacterium RIFCSPLOWO2_01_FULL_37_19]OGZ76087.1 MAG: hypothetical protein A2205_03470 [Candidatus Staskawiczbacteria bacterium RIFOXYA1_FULL_37_15]OGZ77129.1 MAG: hypothetical protein A2280_03420 [Candidatus Staskawiczbacteria bacterium RIFOXYA12_FULL_37_10]OGZ80054.1 MAG: hypothetical protein A2353_02190 [Can